MSQDSPAPPPSFSIAPRREFFNVGNPLGLIGAFTAIVDVSLILAAIFVADIATRAGMLVFAALAFFFVAYRAFWFLEHKPEVLYAPRDYGVIPTIEAYRDATNRTALLAQEATTSVISATVVPVSTESKAQIAATLASAEERTKVVADKVKLEIEETVTVEEFYEGPYLTLVVEDEHRLVPYIPVNRIENRGTETRQISYDPLQWIGQFIIAASEAYKELGFFSTPESYGLTWVMRDRKSGARLSDIGFVRNLGRGVAHTDYRFLSETEVLPGMELEPVALPPPEFPASFPPTSPDDWFDVPVSETSEVDSFDELLHKNRLRPPRRSGPPGTRPPGT